MGSAMKWMLVAGLSLVLAACRPVAKPTPTLTPVATPTPSPVAAPTPAPAPTPAARKPAGTLVYAVGTMMGENWGINRTSGEAAFVSSVYEYLIYNDPKTEKLVPGLAERWHISPDSRTWTFYLRRGIQFHKGWGELTAEDVAYTAKLSAMEGSVNSHAVVWRDTQVQVLGPYKIAFFRPNPDVGLGYVVALRERYGLPIMSKKYVESVGEEKASREPIGTGPYMFVEHKTGEYLKLEALDSHWRQTAYFKTFIFKKVPEDAARIIMLRAGEADLIDLPVELKGEVERAGLQVLRGGIATQSFVSLSGQFLPTRPTYNPNVPWVGPTPERALKVRKALALAINRDEIINTILGGAALPGIVPVAAPGQPGLDPTLKPYPYNPEEAKRLLTEAGYPQGFEVTFRLTVLPGRPEMKTLGEAVAMMWEKVGIKSKLVPIEWAPHQGDLTARAISGIVWVHSPRLWDEPVFGLQQVATSRATRILFVEHPELDKMVDEAVQIADYGQRIAMEEKITRWLHENYWGAPIAAKFSIAGAGKRVGDWLRMPGSEYPLYIENIRPAP